MAYYVKQNDRTPPFEAQLQQGNKKPVNLTTATQVRFHMRNRETKVVKVNQIAQVVTAAEGRVRYEWASGDTDTIGVYDVEVQITWGDGKPQTVPNEGHFELVVGDDLA